MKATTNLHVSSITCRASYLCHGVTACLSARSGTLTMGWEEHLIAIASAKSGAKNAITSCNSSPRVVHPPTSALSSVQCPGSSFGRVHTKPVCQCGFFTLHRVSVDRFVTEHYNICNSSSISAPSSWSTQIGCLSMGSQRTFPYTRHLRKNGRSNARVYVSIVPISRRWRQSSRHLYCMVETHLSAAYPSPLLILEHALASFPSTTSNRSDLEQTHAQQLRRKMQRHASGIVRPTREVSPLKGQDSAHLSTQRVVLT
ncbi:hypothetical protein M433DRAFT_431046 [Acidomyces richmondensis BFW]|nr:MAG: hypothetical protein FE78DRAFT_442174 [Acidomyces sp. 'richmondensis']KYG42145.1 hypothetical protein M433DRAFT_431046 [Acidomyces richmondensis BFW]